MATNMSKVLIFAFIAWIILKPLHKEVHDGDHVFAIIMKSTKVQTLGGNIGTFGLETPLYAYVLGMPSIEPRSSTICIGLSMHVYM